MISTCTWRRLWGSVGFGPQTDTRFMPGTSRRKGFPFYAKITPSFPIEPRSSGVSLQDQSLPLSGISLVITDKSLQFSDKSMPFASRTESLYITKQEQRLPFS